MLKNVEGAIRITVMESTILDQILDETVSISIRANAFEKNMNPSVFLAR